jgi:hypothetical protein
MLRKPHSKVSLLEIPSFLYKNFSPTTITIQKIKVNKDIFKNINIIDESNILKLKLFFGINIDKY